MQVLDYKSDINFGPIRNEANEASPKESNWSVDLDLYTFSLLLTLLSIVFAFLYVRDLNFAVAALGQRQEEMMIFGKIKNKGQAYFLAISTHEAKL